MRAYTYDTVPLKQTSKQASKQTKHNHNHNHDNKNQESQFDARTHIQGHARMVSLLIAAKCDANTRRFDGISACEMAKLAGHSDIFDMLVDSEVQTWKKRLNNRGQKLLPPVQYVESNEVNL